jgi:hypothetical protein
LQEKYVGFESPPLIMEVERGHIKAFAEAIEDPNPLWNDENVARQKLSTGMMAPPTFLRFIRTERLQELPEDFPYNRSLDGGSQWEYFESVKPRDRIKAVTTVTDLYKKSGKLGEMIFVLTTTTYTNQFNKLVATQSNTSIRY